MWSLIIKGTEKEAREALERWGLEQATLTVAPIYDNEVVAIVDNTNGREHLLQEWFLQTSADRIYTAPYPRGTLLYYTRMAGNDGAG